MSVKNDIKNARKALGKKKANDIDSIDLLRKKTNWSEDKVKRILRLIQEEA